MTVYAICWISRRKPVRHGGMLPIVLGTLLLGISLTGCGATNIMPCKGDEQRAVQELLYFGTETPSGRVTSEAWEKFLGEIVTPRFPEGLSAWRASGQWRSASGEVIREPSYVLSLVHPDDAALGKAVQEIVESYKTRFRQEAVLRVTSSACKSF
ncbi:MAG: hypothetical protein A4E19_08195 [Nitrospira sp. SG-bin1]|nr:MAG: hypothetical protein A4E19_08195 [Nitrospira sp. SG-bin1]